MEGKLKQLLGAEVLEAYEALFLACHQAALLGQYIVSGVVPSGMVHQQAITIKDPTPNFMKAWRAIEIKAALEKVHLLEGHWEEVALRWQGRSIRSRSERVKAHKADLSVDERALKGFIALLEVEDGSLAPKIKKLEVEQERNTEVFLNRIVSKVAWAKQLGNEQPTGSHGATHVKTAVPTGRGTFVAPRTMPRWPRIRVRRGRVHLRRDP